MKTHDEISRIVEDLKEYLESIPVQLSTIAKDRNIKIEYRPMGDISGSITRNKEKDGFIISINTKHSINRQRFTMAHELGHYFLHQEDIGDGVVDGPLYRSGLSDSKEVETNILAGEILMPEDVLRKEWRKYIDKHALKLPLAKNYRKNGKEIKDFITTMMNQFIVSEHAMRVRTGLTL